MSLSGRDTMTTLLYIFATVFAVAVAAPPAPHRPFQQYAPAQLQQINQLDYYLDNQEVANYYHQAQQKQGNVNQVQNQGAPARLENLEPDSEVELIPGAQQPQQPPQQNPVSPNIPGLLPGQRVYIVHMPVSGYRPGSVGGYQPVYVVAAAQQGNAGYTPNGYQNAILLDTSGQVVSPVQQVLGYRGVQGINGLQNGVIQNVPGYNGLGQQGINPYYQGGSQLNLQRPFDYQYQDPSLGFQPVQAPHLGNGQTLRLSQLVALHPQQPQPVNSPRSVTVDSPQNTEQKRERVGQSSESADNKEDAEEARRNARPGPPRNKA